MVQKRWLLVFTFVAVLALVVLYIRNSGPEPPRPVPRPQVPSSTPEVAPPLPYGTVKPPPRTKRPVVVADDASFMLVRRVLPQYTKADQLHPWTRRSGSQYRDREVTRLWDGPKYYRRHEAVALGFSIFSRRQKVHVNVCLQIEPLEIQT